MNVCWLLTQASPLYLSGCLLFIEALGRLDSAVALVEIYVKFCQQYTLTTTQTWRMPWGVEVEADHRWRAATMQSLIFMVGLRHSTINANVKHLW